MRGGSAYIGRHDIDAAHNILAAREMGMTTKSTLYGAVFGLLMTGLAQAPALAQEAAAAMTSEPAQPVVIRANVVAEQAAPAAVVTTANPQTPATITLKPHNTKYDKLQSRHQALILQYIQQTADITALVDRQLDLQHRQDLIGRDIRMTQRMIEDTRSRKTKADLQASIDEWEDQLASIGEDAQLANIDLQNALQQQQQTLQIIADVSKLLHDTAMATIRKIGS